MLKFCKKHGDLKVEDIQIEKIKWKTKEGEIKRGEQFRCRICRSEKDIKYKHSHKQKRVAYSTQWKKDNKEKYLNWLKQDRLKNPDKYRKWGETTRKNKGILRSLEESLRVMGMSMEHYNELLKIQNNVCAICEESESRKSRKKGDICRLAIDHCHKSKVIRGLLCSECNTGLGKFKDDVNLLMKAILYLDKSIDVE